MNRNTGLRVVPDHIAVAKQRAQTGRADVSHCGACVLDDIPRQRRVGKWYRIASTNGATYDSRAARSTERTRARTERTRSHRPFYRETGIRERRGTERRANRDQVNIW